MMGLLLLAILLLGEGFQVGLLRLAACGNHLGSGFQVSNVLYVNNHFQYIRRMDGSLHVRVGASDVVVTQ
jgi:hypothetical protein